MNRFEFLDNEALVEELMRLSFLVGWHSKAGEKMGDTPYEKDEDAAAKVLLARLEANNG